MIFRFVSGSLTPARRVRKRSFASTLMKVSLRLEKTASTSSASPLRISPWSTNTQVSRSPMASDSSAAATEESTPPDRASRALPSPISSRKAFTVRVRKSAMVHSLRAPQIR